MMVMARWNKARIMFMGTLKRPLNMMTPLIIDNSDADVLKKFIGFRLCCYL